MAVHDLSGCGEDCVVKGWYCSGICDNGVAGFGDYRHGVMAIAGFADKVRRDCAAWGCDVAKDTVTRVDGFVGLRGFVGLEVLR